MADGRRDPESWLARAWEQGGSPLVTSALSALAVGYRIALALRAGVYDASLLPTGRLPCPVVSIGNLTVGGSGKTPLVELAVLTLSEMGAVPAVVSRGYRRFTRGVQVVADRAGITLGARAAGDEPRLLAERLAGTPVVVGENRYEAGRVAAERLGASVVVLDDGFQNRTIAKDLEVLVLDGRAPWGNGRLFPRGPLREPLAAVRRAHLVVVARPREAGEVEAVTETLRRHGCAAPVVTVSYHPVDARRWQDGLRVPAGELAGQRLLAVAGLASPRGFSETLQEIGVREAGLVDFPDHHWYSAGDLAAVVERARSAGAQGLITTEKDWMRLRELSPPPIDVWVLSARMRIQSSEAAWRRALRSVCAPSLAEK